MFDALIDFLKDYGYWGMGVLSFLSGSVLPISSEILLVFFLNLGLSAVWLTVVATLGIPLTSPALKPSSIQSNSHLEGRTFTSDLNGRLRALYAQSFRTTLAPYVLPRLLARS